MERGDQGKQLNGLFVPGTRVSLRHPTNSEAKGHLPVLCERDAGPGPITAFHRSHDNSLSGRYSYNLWVKLLRLENVCTSFSTVCISCLHLPLCISRPCTHWVGARKASGRIETNEQENVWLADVRMRLFIWTPEDAHPCTPKVPPTRSVALRAAVNILPCCWMR